SEEDATVSPGGDGPRDDPLAVRLEELRPRREPRVLEVLEELHRAVLGPDHEVEGPRARPVDQARRHAAVEGVPCRLGPARPVARVDAKSAAIVGDHEERAAAAEA